MRAVGTNLNCAFTVSPARMVRRVCCTFLAICLMASMSPTALAQPALEGPTNGLPPEVSEKLLQRGDLTLNDVTFRQALFTINEVWGINIFAATDVEGTISGVFTDAPLHEILDSILISNSLTYRPVGNTLVVMKLEDLGDFNPMFRTATITLQAASPLDILPGAEMLKSPRGKIQAIEISRSLLVIDFADRVQMIRDFAMQIDQVAMQSAGAPGGKQLKIGHWAPQFIKVDSLKDPVESVILTSQIGLEGATTAQVSIITAENRLVVVGTAQELAMVDRVVRLMDTPRLQVRITALIYDVSLQDMEKLGINWNQAVKGRVKEDGTADQLFSIDSLMQVPAAAGDPSGVLTFMNLSRQFDLTAVVDALNEMDNTQLLADPSVTVTDRNEAMIEIVTEIPFQQLTQSSLGGNIGTTAFRKAGVTLTVTPHIANDGTILLECKPSFSRLAGFTGGQSPQPIIDTREAHTTVRVRDHQTLVIGGLRQRSDIGDFRGIPGLKNIKFFHIGKLFRHRQTTIQESELIVFITPDVVPLSYMGQPREMQSFGYGNQHLDGIPPGGCAPFPPPRGSSVPIEILDPNHNPHAMPPGEMLPIPDPNPVPAGPPTIDEQARRLQVPQQPGNPLRMQAPLNTTENPANGTIVHRLPMNQAQQGAQRQQIAARRRYPLGPAQGNQQVPLPAVAQQPFVPSEAHRINVAQRPDRPASIRPR